MTTLTNFKSKRVSKKKASCFNIEKLLPKTKRCKRVSDKIQAKIRSGRYVSPAANWQQLNNDAYVDNGRGSPYMLLSETDNLDNKKAGNNSKSSSNTKRRIATCHNVLHEPRLLLEPTDVAPLVRGIRMSICIEHTRFPLVAKVSKKIGLTLVPEHRLWNVQWCDNTPHFDLLKSMKRFQQINHFPGMSEICRKDLLSRNLNRMLKMYPGDYNIFPKTWLLPTDAYDVAVYANRHKRTFILKPYSSGQGRGIWLTNNLHSVGRQEKLICQTYIDRPLLIDGFKFDLRVYTLVTSVDPLRIFVYNEGLARFATHKYNPPALNNSSNLFMHLTNYCVNRRNSNYDAADGNVECGSKRTLSAYNKWLVEHEYSVEEFWASVDDAIIKTVISAWPVLKHNYNLCFPKHDKIQACFQLLGFDILVDWKLKPYILEVNHTPSLLGGEPVDVEVKRPLIRDTLNLISTPLVDKEEIIREDRALLRDRLMLRANRRRVQSNNDKSNTAEPAQRAIGGAEMSQPCSLTALAEQIAWEESHLGNYRRIMPPTNADRVNYYFKFYNQFKQVSMFKGSKTSQGRTKSTREHLRQQQMQEQLKDKQKELQLEQELRQKIKKQKKRNALLVKEIQQEKTNNTGKSPMAIWEMVNKQIMELKCITQSNIVESNDINSPNAKRSTLSIRSRRYRQIQVKTKRARLLEKESRLDAEFLLKYGKKPQSAMSLQVAESCSSKTSQVHKPNDNEEMIEAKAEPNTKLIKLGTIKINKWLPEPIDESQDDWRTERTTAVLEGQFRELLFQEMFERGNLTKNDIKQYPQLLYAILTGELYEKIIKQG